MKNRPLPAFARRAALALAALLPAGAAAAPQTVQRFDRTITRQVGYQYLLSLPTGYDAAPEQRWPLLVFLHGSGERGGDPWQVARHGPPKLLRGDAAAPAGETPAALAARQAATQALAENFIVVSPQCPANAWWDDDAIGALLDELSARQRVDARRIYLTGLSLGGFGTWSYGLKHPDRFAAIVPICGGGETSTVRRMARTRKADLLSLGVWVFHGAKDPTVPVEESQQMVDALKKAGATDVQFTVYPEAKHDSWTETYANPELYAWLLKHERRPAAALK